MLGLLFATSLLSSCVKREEVLAEIWLQSGLPKELCDKYPEIQEYGIYRKLNDDKFEVLTYCAHDEAGTPRVQNYLSIHKDKFYEILDELLPEQPK